MKLLLTGNPGKRSGEICSSAEPSLMIIERVIDKRAGQVYFAL
jgi:hypothetical protein